MTTRRTLLLLRHGKSDWSAGAADDFSRPLAKRGRKDSPRMGAWMRSTGLLPECIVSSPASRARETVELVCRAAGLEPGIVVLDEALYLADLDDLLAIARQLPERAAMAMLVGHNPGLEALLLYLAGNMLEAPDDGKYLPTSSLAHLRIDGDWQDLHAGAVTHAEIMRARNLPKARRKR